jgi:DNA-binding CsgD family transcriptional regulator
MPTPTVRLTRRERDVLRLAAKGYTTREIAQKLYVSPRTVEAHIQNAITKLDLLDRYRELGLDPPNGGGAGVREPRRTPPSSGPASSSADEPSV